MQIIDVSNSSNHLQQFAEEQQEYATELKHAPAQALLAQEMRMNPMELHALIMILAHKQIPVLVEYVWELTKKFVLPQTNVMLQGHVINLQENAEIILLCVMEHLVMMAIL
jgi:hypothetical protein